MTFADWYSQADFWLAVGKPIHDWLVGLGVPGWLVSLVYVAVGAAAILGVITVSVIMSLGSLGAKAMLVLPTS